MATGYVSIGRARQPLGLNFTSTCSSVDEFLFISRLNFISAAAKGHFKLVTLLALAPPPVGTIRSYIEDV